MFFFPNVTAVYHSHPFDDRTIYGLSDIDLAIKVRSNGLSDFYKKITILEKVLTFFPLIDSKGIIFFDDNLLENKTYQQSIFYLNHYPLENWVKLFGDDSSLFSSPLLKPLDHIEALSKKIWKRFSITNRSLISERNLHVALNKGEKLFGIQLQGKTAFNKFMHGEYQFINPSDYLQCEHQRCVIPDGLKNLEENLSIFKLYHPLSQRDGKFLEWTYFFVIKENIKESDFCRMTYSINSFIELNQVKKPEYFEISVIPENLLSLLIPSYRYTWDVNLWRNVFGKGKMPLFQTQDELPSLRFHHYFHRNLIKTQAFKHKPYKCQQFIAITLSEIHRQHFFSYNDFLNWGKSKFDPDFMKWLSTTDRQEFGQVFHKHFNLFLKHVEGHLYEA